MGRRQLTLEGTRRAPARPPAPRPEEPVVGSKVGAQRWPSYAAHPDCWGRPWSGIVLARHDPRAWHGSIAFFHLGDQLSKAETIPHVLRHWEHLQTEVPVLWSFVDAYGKPTPRVYWEKISSVRPYADDLEAWMCARGEARGAGEERRQAVG